MCDETVTVAALLGFSTYPVDESDVEWLAENAEVATFALRVDDLPHGGWTNQGYAFECTVMLAVPVDSREAQSAAANSGPPAPDHTGLGEVLTSDAARAVAEHEDDYFPLGWQNRYLNDVSATKAMSAYLAGLSNDFVDGILVNYGNYFAAVRAIAERQWVGKQYVNPQDNRVIAIASRVMFFSNGAPTVTSIAAYSK